MKSWDFSWPIEWEKNSRLNCVHVLIFGIRKFKSDYLNIPNHLSKLYDQFDIEILNWLEIKWEENLSLNFAYPYVNPILILLFKNLGILLVQYKLVSHGLKQRGSTHLVDMNYTVSKLMIMIDSKQMQVFNSWKAYK